MNKMLVCVFCYRQEKEDWSSVTSVYEPDIFPFRNCPEFHQTGYNSCYNLIITLVLLNLSWSNDFKHWRQSWKAVKIGGWNPSQYAQWEIPSSSNGTHVLTDQWSKVWQRSRILFRQWNNGSLSKIKNWALKVLREWKIQADHFKVSDEICLIKQLWQSILGRTMIRH